MIATCREQGKVLTLPIPLHSGEPFAFQLSLVLSQVNCDKCDALCCKNDDNHNGITLMSQDREVLEKMNLGHLIKGAGIRPHLAYPCPLLKKKQCTIYADRPIACLLYPFQSGGSITDEHILTMAVSSSCPEGRRIARQVFIMAWHIRQRVNMVTSTDFQK